MRLRSNRSGRSNNRTCQRVLLCFLRLDSKEDIFALLTFSNAFAYKVSQYIEFPCGRDTIHLIHDGAGAVSLLQKMWQSKEGEVERKGLPKIKSVQSNLPASENATGTAAGVVLSGYVLHGWLPDQAEPHGPSVSRGRSGSRSGPWLSGLRNLM